ncbi:MAG TPA: hypothetical protein VF618_25760 [Thermoanaerobaculia bacterium]
MKVPVRFLLSLIFVFTATAAFAGGISDCTADMSSTECAMLSDASTPYGYGGNTTTYSILCTDTYGCKWCDVDVAFTKSLCTRHRFAPGFCLCKTAGSLKNGQAYCYELKGSCRYI